MKFPISYWCVHIISHIYITFCGTPFYNYIEKLTDNFPLKYLFLFHILLYSCSFICLPLSSHEFCIFYCLSSINCLLSLAVVASHFWHVLCCGALPLSVSPVALSLVYLQRVSFPHEVSALQLPLLWQGDALESLRPAVFLPLQWFCPFSEWSSLVPLIASCHVVLTTCHQSLLGAILDIDPHVCFHFLRLSPSCFFM